MLCSCVPQSYENRQKVAKDLYLANKAVYEANKQKPEEVEVMAVVSVVSPPSVFVADVYQPEPPKAIAPVPPAAEPVVASEAESDESSDSDSSEEDDEEEDEQGARPAAKKVKPATPPPPPPPKLATKKSKKVAKTKA